MSHNMPPLFMQALPKLRFEAPPIVDSIADWLVIPCHPAAETKLIWAPSWQGSTRRFDPIMDHPFIIDITTVPCLQQRLYPPVCLHVQVVMSLPWKVMIKPIITSIVKFQCLRPSNWIDWDFNNNCEPNSGSRIILLVWTTMKLNSLRIRLNVTYITSVTWVMMKSTNCSQQRLFQSSAFSSSIPTIVHQNITLEGSTILAHHWPVVIIAEKVKAEKLINTYSPLHLWKVERQIPCLNYQLLMFEQQHDFFAFNKTFYIVTLIL